MADHINRIIAHLDMPEVYDPPNLLELTCILNEMKASREFANMLYKSIMGGGETVTFSQSDITTIAALRGSHK
jgi:hypothetical protein